MLNVYKEEEASPFTTNATRLLVTPLSASKPEA
nr:MAG TPA: hypothetical protein [Caudoviricetes sp.]